MNEEGPAKVDLELPGEKGVRAGVGQSDRFLLLLELSRAFSSRLDFDELLPLVLRRCKEVLRAEGCSLLLHDEKTSELYFPATSSVTAGVDERLRDLRFSVTQGIAGEVMRTARPLLVSNAEGDSRFYADVDAVTGAQTVDILCAPLRTHAGVVGVIEVLNHQGSGFDEDDLSFLNALASSVAIAVENAQLVGAMRLSEKRLQNEVGGLRRERVHKNPFPEVIGRSPAMERVFSLMESAVDSSISVLIEGRTGVGKEVIAGAIHANGPRVRAPFVTINCGALPVNLLESELFGFSRGAFTGATRDKQGLFEAADGGTLFLDEIAETPPELQVKLLRALQEGEVRRIGETKARRVDVRLISATNCDLAVEVRERRFREDLFYRVSVFPIVVPPLCERREDIPSLVTHLLQRIGDRLGRPVGPVASGVLDHLMHYEWPGNVRELENELERAVALATAGKPIVLDCLSERILASARTGLNAGQQMASRRVKDGGSLRAARDAFEREFIAEVLERHGGNATRAAIELGLSRQMLQRKIRNWNLRQAKNILPATPR